jgi:Spy/CpxP family protein refolding chaperone
MMGGYYGGGMGPGMMGGYYGGGMGPGMMGGYHGRYGPGMMGGYRGPCGPGMMEWRPDALGLSRDQTAKIDKLRDEGHKKHWELAGKLMDENAHLRDLNYADRRDPAAIGRQYAKVQDIERQMLEQSIDTDNRIESLLTNEQRTRLRSLCR